MFYPVESLKRGGRFYLCWVADSWPLRFATITHRQLWSQDVRHICDELMEVMRNESGRATRRFSLRLSSQLMRGLVRLYQRKVTVFLGDLCMINANVIKLVNKKFVIHKRVTAEPRPRPSRVAHQPPENEERVEEMIQQSGNTVANVQDITLKEPTLPEYQPMLNDNFGELNPEQILLADKTMEMMLAQDVSAAQHSAVDLPALDFSADKSADKSRHQEAAQMEAISELDATMFRTSMGRDAFGVDVEKEVPPIPEIPEIPPPDLSALPTDIQVAEKEKDIGKEQEPVVEEPVEKESSDIVLEELEDTEPQAKRRRLRVKIDKKTTLTSNYLRSRIGNVAVELRCEDSSDDVIFIRVPADVLLGRPARAGARVRSAICRSIASLFTRNLGVVDRRPLADREMEEAVAHRSMQSRIRPVLEKIVEEVEPIPPCDAQMQRIENNDPMSKEGGFDVTMPRISAQEVDFAELPTQVLETMSQAKKRTAEYEKSPKRPRRSGYVSYRQSQQIADTIPPYEADKENIPQNIQIELEQTVNTERDLTGMLQEAGLADLPMQKQVESEKLPSPMEIPIIACQRTRRNGSDRSETPLGSLDRTKVSLGDSDKTTDSKRFIRDQWGTEGTMIKILNCIKEGVTPLDVTSIITKGPLISGYKRIIAARCFTSILKLKQHGFINIYKDPNTLNITDITLGSKFD